MPDRYKVITEFEWRMFDWIDITTVYDDISIRRVYLKGGPIKDFPLDIKDPDSPHMVEGPNGPVPAMQRVYRIPDELKSR